MKVINQVISTTDYSKFKSLQGNRDVNKLHVRRLKESFQQAYLLSPILINLDYEIIDGQHRFNAAKELGLPINFIICNDYGIKEVQLLNTNMKNWRSEDYLQAYCNLGYAEYLQFRQFYNKYNMFSINVCELLLSQKTQPMTKHYELPKNGKTEKRKKFSAPLFKDGNFKIASYADAVDTAEKLLMISKYYDGYNRASFVQAMLGLLKNANFNFAKFLDKLALQPTALQHCINLTQYKMLIEEIYNYKNREKVNLRY